MGALSALSFLAPIGESLGGTMQQVGQRQQQEATRAGYGKLLEGLGLDYKPLQEAFNQGMSIHDVTAALGGPIGKQLLEKHRSEQLANIFQNPEDYRNPDKLRQAYLQDLLPEAVGAKLFESATPKDEFERYVQDVKGYSLDAFSALPDAERQKAYDDFQKEKAKKGAQPIGDTPTGDPGMEAYLAKNPAARNLTFDKAFNAYKKETSLNAQEKGALDDAQTAIPELERMLEAGKAVLPEKPGWGALGAKFDRWIKTGQGYPELTHFEATKAAEVEVVKSIARTTRISQYELAKVVGGLENATTYPALQVAVNDAINMCKTSISVLKYRGMGPMDGGEAAWSGSGYDDPLNAATEGAEP